MLLSILKDSNTCSLHEHFLVSQVLSNCMSWESDRLGISVLDLSLNLTFCLMAHTLHAPRSTDTRCMLIPIMSESVQTQLLHDPHLLSDSLFLSFQHAVTVCAT